MEDTITELKCRADRVAAEIAYLRSDSNPPSKRTMEHLLMKHRTLTKEYRVLELSHQNKTSHKTRRDIRREAAARRGESLQWRVKEETNDLMNTKQDWRMNDEPNDCTSLFQQDCPLNPIRNKTIWRKKDRKDAPLRKNCISGGKEPVNTDECLDFWMGLNYAESDTPTSGKRRIEIVSLTAGTCLNIYDVCDHQEGEDIVCSTIPSFDLF